MRLEWSACGVLSALLVTAAGAVEGSEDSLKRNKAVARVIFDQVLRHPWRVDLVDAVHTPDFVAHGVTRDANLEENRQAVLGWKSAAPDMTMEVEAMVAEGDLVAVRWAGRGTNTGEGNGLPATGRKFTFRGVTFFRLRDGRIAEEWNVIDKLDGLRQLGLLPEARGSSTPAAADVSEENRALAQRVFDEILNQAKYQVFDQIFAKDFVKHVDRREQTLAEEIRDAKAMRAASSDLFMTVDQMIAQGDKVAVLYTGRGTNTGPFAGLPATGRTYAVSGMTLYRISGGKIVEEWTTYNMLDILRQLGHASAQ